MLWKYRCYKANFELICTILMMICFSYNYSLGLIPTLRTTAQNLTPFVCGRGGGASARKGVKMGRAGYDVISSWVALFAIIQAVQPRSDKK